MYVTIPMHADTAPTPVGILRNANKILPTAIKAGGYLYYEGDDVLRLYRVLEGVVRLTRLLDDGRRQVISFGYPGDIIGFPANGRHHTDCDALTNATLQPFSRSALDHGNGDPELHLALLQAALNEISAMQDHFLMLGRKSASEKVASFLSVLAARFGEETDGVSRIRLPMGRSDIADFLGLTTETVSRTITVLKRKGVIALRGAQTIDVLDPVGLRRISKGKD